VVFQVFKEAQIHLKDSTDVREKSIK